MVAPVYSNFKFTVLVQHLELMQQGTKTDTKFVDLSNWVLRKMQRYPENKRPHIHMLPAFAPLKFVLTFASKKCVSVHLIEDAT